MSEIPAEADYSVDGQEEEHRSDTDVLVRDDDGQSHCDGNNVKRLKRNYTALEI